MGWPWWAWVIVIALGWWALMCLYLMSDLDEDDPGDW